MQRLALYLTSLFGALSLALPALAGIATPMVPPIPAYAEIIGPPVAAGYVVPAGYAAPVAYAGRQGCWQSYNPIYGLYNVAFCLGTKGSGAYRVNGGGYDCQGRSRWHRQGQTIVYQMQLGTCGAKADWTADRIYCRGNGRGQNLACTYAPATNSQKPTGFNAFRQ